MINLFRPDNYCLSGKEAVWMGVTFATAHVGVEERDFGFAMDGFAVQRVLRR